MNHEHSEHEHHHHHDSPTQQIPKEYQAYCPVTSDLIDTREAEKLGHYRDYNGKRIYLCCATCVQLFDKHPEKYVHHHDAAIQLTLVEKENLVDNIWAFRFTSTQPLTWIPGQFIRVELDHDNPDDEGTKRFFTISSAPYEEIVQITTRVTDSTFKQALAALTIGGALPMIKEPDGDFVWQASERSLVFIAGGIGVTPFRSILKQRVHDGQPLNATLIYSGRDENLPFKEEFDTWAVEHPELTVKYVIGERLTSEKIAELQPTINESLVYISGPEPMVETLGHQLKAAGLPDGQLQQDFFPNYNESNY